MWWHSTLSFVLLMLKVLETGAKDPPKVVFTKHRNTAMTHSAAQFNFSIEECAQRCLGVELGCVGFDYSAGICTISYVLLTVKRTKTDAYIRQKTPNYCNANHNQGTQDLMHGKFVLPSAQCISETMIMRPMPKLRGRRGSVVSNPQPNCLQYCLLTEDCEVVGIDASSVCRLVLPDGSGDVRYVNTAGTLHVKMDSCAAPRATPLSVSPPGSKDTLVNIHNRVRAEIARGQFEIPGDKLPAAKNMRKLKWNFTLEIEAQFLANKCHNPVKGLLGMNPDKDTTTDGPYGVGEPAHISSECRRSCNEPPGNVALCQKKRRCGCLMIMVAQKLTQQWVNVRSGNKWSDLYYNAPTQTELDNSMQLMWAESREFGCGITSCKDKSITFVCLYWPPGKVRNVPIYAEGKTCTACPSGTECIEEGAYSGLCD